MKMYIFIKDSLTLGFAMVSAAHASLETALKFCDDPDYNDWVDNSFKKVVCKVTDEEFEAAKDTDKCVVLTENNLDGIEVAIGFCPRTRDKWPQWFRELPLYS